MIIVPFKQINPSVLSETGTFCHFENVEQLSEK